MNLRPPHIYALQMKHIFRATSCPLRLQFLSLRFQAGLYFCEGAMMSVMAEKEIEDAHIEHKFLCDTIPNCTYNSYRWDSIPYYTMAAGDKLV